MMKKDSQNSIWHLAVVRRILQNEIYIGNMVQGKKNFFSAQQIFKTCERTRNKSLNLLLRGLVVCKA